MPGRPTWRTRQAWKAAVFLGLLERRPALIETAIAQSQKLGRVTMESDCRTLLATLAKQGGVRISKK
jgi:hypothetical protein